MPQKRYFLAASLTNIQKQNNWSYLTLFGVWLSGVLKGSPSTSDMDMERWFNSPPWAKKVHKLFTTPYFLYADPDLNLRMTIADLVSGFCPLKMSCQYDKNKLYNWIIWCLQNIDRSGSVNTFDTKEMVLAESFLFRDIRTTSQVMFTFSLCGVLNSPESGWERAPSATGCQFYSLPFWFLIFSFKFFLLTDIHEMEINKRFRLNFFFKDKKMTMATLA